MTLTAEERVTVRADTFPGSLKLLETVSWEERYGNRERTFWLAPGVGLVKWNETVSEFISGEGERTEESSWELILGCVDGELILPTFE